jgi:hypothetical protein
MNLGTFCPLEKKKQILTPFSTDPDMTLGFNFQVSLNIV